MCVYKILVNICIIITYILYSDNKKCLKSRRKTFFASKRQLKDVLCHNLRFCVGYIYSYIHVRAREHTYAHTLTKY